MNITLFIDESGDFTNFRKNWILGGLLCFNTYEEANKQLSNVCAPLPSNNGLTSIKDFHLTEIRKNDGSENAVKVSSSLFNAILNSKLDVRFLGVINESKRSTDDREKNYRLMLLDLIALAEAHIKVNEQIHSFELVIASRTINSIRQTTTSDIKFEMSNNYKLSLEEGLISKGLAEIANKNILSIVIKYANDSWGLVAADFISNTISNRNGRHDKYVLSRLETQGVYYSFESFGGAGERRARIAERDLNYVSAVTRWIELNSNLENFEERKKIAIIRIMENLRNNRSIKQFHETVEGTIENIWRKGQKSGDYTIAFQELSYLKLYSFDRSEHSNTVTLFKLNNRILQCLDHLGEVKESEKIIIEQNDLIKKIAIHPEGLSDVFNYYLFEIDFYLNKLMLIKGFEKAKFYFNLIQNYKTTTELLYDDKDLSDFKCSRLFQRANNTLLRTAYFGIFKFSESEKNNYYKKIEAVDFNKYNNSDRARFLDLILSIYIKCADYKKAFKIANLILEGEMNVFQTYRLLKLVNDYTLSKNTDYKETISIIRLKIENYNFDNKNGHPFELLHREMALNHYLIGSDSRTISKHFQMSKEILSKYGSNNGAIIKWLMNLLQAHKDFINGHQYKIRDYVKGIEETDLYKIITENDIDTLTKLRNVSPY